MALLVMFSYKNEKNILQECSRFTKTTKSEIIPDFIDFGDKDGG